VSVCGAIGIDALRISVDTSKGTRVLVLPRAGELDPDSRMG